jgi:topoisomerase-4 subunit B
MRTDLVTIPPETPLTKVLGYFMGKNTPQRQEFIVDNLKLEEEVA